MGQIDNLVYFRKRQTTVHESSSWIWLDSWALEVRKSPWIWPKHERAKESRTSPCYSLVRCGAGAVTGSSGSWVATPCPRTDTPLGLPRRHGRGRRAAGAAGAAARQEPHQDPVLPGGLRHWRILLLLDAALLQPSSKQHRRPRCSILLFIVGVVLAGVLLPQVLRVLLASPAASPAHLHPEVCVLTSPFSCSQTLRRRPRL